MLFVAVRAVLWFVGLPSILVGVYTRIPCTDHHAKPGETASSSVDVELL